MKDRWPESARGSRLWDWDEANAPRVTKEATLEHGVHHQGEPAGRRPLPSPWVPVSSVLPDAARFEAPVYGTIFAERAAAVSRLCPGEGLILVPDPPGIDDHDHGTPADERLVVEAPKVWVHAIGGHVLGHLSPDINRWLVPRMLAGTRYTATVLSLGDPAQESWRRLVIEVVRTG